MYTWVVSALDIPVPLIKWIIVDVVVKCLYTWAVSALDIPVPLIKWIIVC